jgi:DNA-binding transcriptional ArsR family regulator
MECNRDVTPAEVAAALADPLRILVLQRMLEGPVNVAELVAAVGTSQPNVSNHLAVLRRRGLVRAERRGRQVVYRIAGPSVAQLIESLSSLSSARSRPAVPAPIAVARTCYDHLAGRLGVDLLRGLRRARAVSTPSADGVIDLGTNGERVFGRLGVDLADAASTRRRFAFACLDWTEEQAHLGGALGAALCASALERGWILRQRGTRALLPTTTGRSAFRRVLGVTI